MIFLSLIVIIAAYGNRRLAKQRNARLAAMSPAKREAFLENEKKSIAAKHQEDNEHARALREQWGNDVRDRRGQQNYGAPNPAMVCPHCSVKGMVRTRRVKQKKGVSGGKATAALLTGGFSMLVTGLSRKEKGTLAYCENCRNQWIF